VEILQPPSTPDLADYLAAEGIEIAEGCEGEVNLRALGWIGSVARRLRSGYVVTVDYGDEGPRLYGPSRPRGTCVAYRGHRIVQNLLDFPGLQDITAHVNFSAIQRAGAGHGLVAAPLLNQRDFLFSLGLAEEVERLEAHGLPDSELIETRRALAPLIFPGPGMGESFKALVQAKGAALDDLALGTSGAMLLT
jgi:SAM-dependent MidA family methyltransferase